MFKKQITQYKRRRYVKAMMNAITKIREGPDGKISSKTDALRVIRKFERVNSCTFNPFDFSHVITVMGYGIFVLK
ncbi:hypothetical protein GW931_02790 [archaeon]|nr:hypothetical protein [archaeon]